MHVYIMHVYTVHLYIMHLHTVHSYIARHTNTHTLQTHLCVILLWFCMSQYTPKHLNSLSQTHFICGVVWV